MIKPRLSYKRKEVEKCPHCKGTGRVNMHTVQARAKANGNATFLKSLKPGALTMSERGKMGGRPRAWHLREKRPDLFVEVARDLAG